MKAPPVIVFPVHGCKPAWEMNERESVAHLKKLRETIRGNWHHDGVKAAMQMLEHRAAILQRQAVQPGSGPHDAGQAFAVGELLALFHSVMMTEEEA